MAQVSDIGQFDFNKFLTSIEEGASVVQDTAQSAEKFVKDPLAASVKSLTFSTNYSPEKKLTGQQLSAKFKEKTPNPLLKLLQPTLVIETTLGSSTTIAPYGKADTGIWKARVVQALLLPASVLLLAGVGIYVWGRSVGRKGG